AGADSRVPQVWPALTFWIKAKKVRLSSLAGVPRPCLWLVFKRSVIHFVREDDKSMNPPSNVKTPAQYIPSPPADRAKTIATVRALVNKHIPPGYDECLVWGTIGWTIPLSRYPDTYNKQPICYVALSSQKNYCSLYLMGAFWSASQLEQLRAAFQAAGKKLDMGKCCVHFELLPRRLERQIGRAHLSTPVTDPTRMPPSPC